MVKKLNLHLVSDSTGETVGSVARAVTAQFDIEVKEYFWTLVRTKKQIDQIIENIQQNNGFVMYTIVDYELRKYFKSRCANLHIACVSVLSRVVSDLSSFLGIKATVLQPGKQYELDEEYFSRVEAVNFSICHDDGQSTWDVDEADIILVGVSRTSKSPTSMYLANKGYRCANVPFVPGVQLPENMYGLKNTLVVGLTIAPEVLVQIRKNRLLSLNQDDNNIYTDIDQVKEELLEAKRFFNKNNWPVIDVTRRSIEETVANIIKIYKNFKNKGDKNE